MKSRAYLSLGSNIGDRIGFMGAAEEKLDSHSDIKILDRSQIYETEPWPLHDVVGLTEDEHPVREEGQKWYLNQVVLVETDLGPHELLNVLNEIENEIGRTKKHHWGSREIDIDILIYDDLVVETPELSIPHRHMNDRQFILVPLLEIAPKLKSPTNGRSYKDILMEIEDDHRVVPFI